MSVRGSPVLAELSLRDNEATRDAIRNWKVHVARGSRPKAETPSPQPAAFLKRMPSRGRTSKTPKKLENELILALFCFCHLGGVLGFAFS